MPYIDPLRRAEITSSTMVETAGELNWLLTTLVDEYIYKKGLSYQVINEVIGVFECAKLELYRRVASPYEDSKLKQNGDVYTVDH